MYAASLHYYQCVCLIFSQTITNNFSMNLDSIQKHGIAAECSFVHDVISKEAH